MIDRGLSRIQARLCAYAMVVGLLIMPPLARSAAPTGVSGQGLIETYQQARQADTQSRIAHAKSRSAKAQYHGAFGKLLPQITAHGQYQRVSQTEQLAVEGFESDSRAKLNANSYSFNLNQELFNWHDIQATRAAASQAEAARQKANAADQNLMVRTAQGYFAVLSARDQLEAAHRKTDSIRRQLKRAKAQYLAGVKPVTDAQEAQSRLDVERVDALEARNKLDTARQKLQKITDVEPERLRGVQIGEPLPFMVHRAANRSLREWIQIAEKNSPTYKAAKLAYRAARRNVAAAKARYLPRISLVGQIGHQEQLYPTNGLQADETTQTYAIGAEVTMPLFAGGTIHAAVDQARATTEQARLEMISTGRDLRAQVKNAWQKLQLNRQRVKAIANSIASAKKARRAAIAGHKYGTQTIQDVIDAELRVVNEQTRWNKAWYEYAVALLQLRRDAGLLGYQSLVRINTFLRY